MQLGGNFQGIPVGRTNRLLNPLERTEMSNVQPVRSFVLLCLSFVAAIGCGSSSKKVPIGGGCVLNSECDNPLACKFMKCHHACDESRDCDPGQRCVKVDGIGVCQLPAEAAFV